MICSTNLAALKKHCNLRFSLLARRNCQREIRNFSRFSFNCNSIPFKKYKCSDGACALVSVDEKVIHDEFKKLDLVQLLCQPTQIVAKLFVDRFETCCQFLLARLVSTWRYQDLVAIRAQLEWRFGRNLKHIQDWLVDHQGKTIVVFNASARLHNPLTADFD